tara:strand:- start:2320 stop:2712 length:393 start_codon:yes stop_codon:yes gene_type:complete
MGAEPTHRESIGHRAYVAQTLEKRQMKTRYQDIETEDVLVENYGELVRRGREKLRLDHVSLASKISEKKSIIASVEAGNMKPTEKLIKKLENFLKIKLTESVDLSNNTATSSSNQSLTMGDLIKQAMEKD